MSSRAIGLNYAMSGRAIGLPYEMSGREIGADLVGSHILCEENRLDPRLVPAEIKHETSLFPYTLYQEHSFWELISRDGSGATHSWSRTSPQVFYSPSPPPSPPPSLLLLLPCLYLLPQPGSTIHDFSATYGVAGAYGGSWVSTGAGVGKWLDQYRRWRSTAT
eukprot:2893730-Rhodomonas_salina.6